MTATTPHPDLDTVTLSPLHRAALTHLPADLRHAAARLPVYIELGFGEMETAQKLGMTWKALDNLRHDLQGGFVKALEADGYSDAEIARYLGIPTGAVTAHTHEPTCHRGMSGELEAQCQCRAIRSRRERQAEDGPKERARDGEW